MTGVTKNGPATADTASREWWRGAVIYQIYPRSYQDTTGDGSGNLAGIAQRLEHVAKLGADAIWISPFFKSPMADMGYDVSDYKAVDPMFGTLEDFDAVVAEAHRLGLKVIIDQVLSHTSDQHAWFRESRADRTNDRADWYVWADPQPDGSPPNNWLSVFGGPSWEWDSVRRQFYLHNFLVSQPDLNFHNPDVQDAVLDAVRFWLDRGVDGFRLDTVNYYFHDQDLRSNPAAPLPADGLFPTNPYDAQQHLHDKARPENIAFLQRFRALLEEYDDRCAVGEVGDSADRALRIVSEYTAGGDKLHMCYTFDMLGGTLTPAHVAGCIREFERTVTDGWICWAFSNHDVIRHVTRWTPEGADPARVAKLSVALLAAMRGSICLYQGEELGLPEAELAFEELRDPYGIRFWPGFKGRDGARTPMPWQADAPHGGFTSGTPWLPVRPEHRALAVSAQGAGSVLDAYRETIAFRKATPALAAGAIEIVEVAEDVLAFVRGEGADAVLCVFNLSERPVKWSLPQGWSNAALLPGPDFGAGLGGAAAQLPAFSALFAAR